MTKDLKAFLDGVAQAVVIYPDTRYTYPRTAGFSADAEKLRADAKNVGSDMKKSISRAQNGK